MLFYYIGRTYNLFSNNIDNSVEYINSTVKPASKRGVIMNKAFQDAVLDAMQQNANSKGIDTKKTSAITKSKFLAKHKKKYEKLWSKLKENCESFPSGTGLYTIACCMNHSCTPNVAVMKYEDGRDDMTCFLATKSIAANEVSIQLNQFYLHGELISFWIDNGTCCTLK
jgi:hypothetical protein